MTVAHFHSSSRLAILLAAVLLAAIPASAQLHPEDAVPVDRAEYWTPSPSRDQSDRNVALACYSTGRLHELQGDTAAALRRYERASRYDPDHAGLRARVVTAAMKLDRVDEAVRYALPAETLPDVSPLVVRRLAMHAIENADWADAAKLYALALKACEDNGPPTMRVLFHLQRGRSCFLAGQTDEAIESLTHALDAIDAPEEHGLNLAMIHLIVQSPDDQVRLLAEARLASGDLARAETLFQRYAQSAGDDRRLPYDMARIDLQRGDAAKAIERLETQLATPDEEHWLGPYRLLVEAIGSLHDAKEGDPPSDDVIDHLTKLLEASPDDLAMRYVLAEAHVAREEWAKAEPLLNTVAEAEDGPVVEPLLAETRLGARDAEGLIEVLAAAHDQYGDLSLVADSVQSLLDDEELLNKVVETASSDEPWRKAAVASLLLLAADRPDEADGLFRKAVEPSLLQADDAEAASVLGRWGAAMLAVDRPKDAAWALSLAADRGTDKHEKVADELLLATALAMDDRTDEALEAARRAEARSPSAAGRLRIAWILLDADRVEEARDVYREVLDQYDAAPGSPLTRDAVAQARSVLSMLASDEGRHDEAVELLETILDEFPDDPGALNDLGYLWADAGENLPRALAMIEQAVAADPENGAFRDSLGWALYRLGRSEEARHELETAVESHPDPEVLEHLGDVCIRLEASADARSAYERAVEEIGKLTGRNAAEHVEREKRLRGKIAELPSAD